MYPGSIKLKANEDGEYKKERLGNTVPTVSGGFGLNARWKGFDFTAFFNYSLGNKIVNATKLGSSFTAVLPRIGISMTILHRLVAILGSIHQQVLIY